MASRGFLLCLLVTGLVSACGNGDTGRVQGYVEGEYLRLAAGRPGPLDAIQVSRGDTVKAGEVLFTVDATAEKAALNQARASLSAAQSRLADLQKGMRPEELDVIREQARQARAQLQLAQSQLKRAKDLEARGLASKEQLDQAVAQQKSTRAQVAELDARLKTGELAGRKDALQAASDEVEAASAAVDAAQWNLDQKTVTAPEGGSIEDVYYRLGEWVAAGAPVVELLPPENRRLRFFVSEPELGALHVGQRVVASCDGCKSSVAATISFISSTTEFTPPVIYSRQQRSRLVYRVEAEPDAKDALLLHPGQPVDVELQP